MGSRASPTQSRPLGFTFLPLLRPMTRKTNDSFKTQSRALVNAFLRPYEPIEQLRMQVVHLLSRLDILQVVEEMTQGDRETLFGHLNEVRHPCFQLFFITNSFHQGVPGSRRSRQRISNSFRYFLQCNQATPSIGFALCRTLQV